MHLAFLAFLLKVTRQTIFGGARFGLYAYLIYEIHIRSSVSVYNDYCQNYSTCILFHLAPLFFISIPYCLSAPLDQSRWWKIIGKSRKLRNRNPPGRQNKPLYQHTEFNIAKQSCRSRSYASKLRRMLGMQISSDGALPTSFKAKKLISSHQPVSSQFPISSVRRVRKGSRC